MDKLLSQYGKIITELLSCYLNSLRYYQGRQQYWCIKYDKIFEKNRKFIVDWFLYWYSKTSLFTYQNILKKRYKFVGLLVRNSKNFKGFGDN